ncbi:PilZ domain-containing protein [Allorhizobium undicola]
MDEKRIAPRIRALKAGRIVYNNGFSTLDCMVRNISETGAKLAADNLGLVPDAFDLQIDGQQRRHCEVRWRKLKEIGVHFVE